jgi:hypothetical protein
MVLTFESDERSGKQKTSRPEGAGGKRRRTKKVPALHKQEGEDDELGGHRCGHQNQRYTCWCTSRGTPAAYPRDYPSATCLARDVIVRMSEPHQRQRQDVMQLGDLPNDEREFMVRRNAARIWNL